LTDHTSTTKQIAEAFGCSVATVNNKAKQMDIRLKGRTPQEHEKLLEKLAHVQPRKKRKSNKNKSKKGALTPVPGRVTRRKSAAKTSHTATKVASYLDDGKRLVADIQARLVELDKERDQLQQQLVSLSRLFTEVSEERE